MCFRLRSHYKSCCLILIVLFSSWWGTFIITSDLYQTVMWTHLYSKNENFILLALKLTKGTQKLLYALHFSLEDGKQFISSWSPSLPFWHTGTAGWWRQRLVHSARQKAIWIPFSFMSVLIHVTLLQIKYVSDVGPHMKVTLIWFEKIRFLCPHKHEKIRSVPH